MRRTRWRYTAKSTWHTVLFAVTACIQLFVFVAVSLLSTTVVDFVAEDAETVYQGSFDVKLGGISAKIPRSLALDNWIMTDVAIMDTLDCGKRSIRMLRALTCRRFTPETINALREDASLATPALLEPLIQ
jgi:hypothetical protein